MNMPFHARWTSWLAAGLAAACLLAHAPAAQAGPYGATQCAGSRFGSNLNCTANDVRITSVSATDGVQSCIAGDIVNLDFNVTVNSGQPNRYDIGIFFSNDGKDPQLLPSSGGSSSCKVVVLPLTAPFLDTDGGATGDMCGDVNGNMNPGLIGPVDSSNKGILAVSGVDVLCQSKTGSGGKLWIPFILSWDQKASPSGGLCVDNTDPVPGTTSKCNAPTVEEATVGNVVVLPKIEKSDGITVIDRGQTTNYSVVITNNTGAAIGAAPTPDATNAIFKDPALNANPALDPLENYGVSCTATGGGATCPAPGDVTVAAMQGSGITIPQMPAGSSVTFTVTARVKNDADLVPYGMLITNTASVTTQGQTNSASDTNTVGLTALNHYELSLPANSVACAPTTVTVTACAGIGGSSPCTNIYSSPGLSGTLSVSSTTGLATLASTSPTFTTGVATTTLNYTSANNGNTAIVSLDSIAPTASFATLCCQGGSCVTGTTCTTTYARNAMFVSDTLGGSAANVPNQTAGVKSGRFFVRAVKTKADGSCDNALKGSATINFGYECKNPATCYGADMMKIETVPTTTIARNNNGSVAATTSVPMEFDNDGYAPFYITYEDVGLVTVHMQSVAAGLSGSSNAFVVKPYDFVFPTNFATCVAPNCALALGASAVNPGAADETGLPFARAGSPFSIAVRAVAASLSATPSYGRESPSETVKLTPTLVSPLYSVGGFYPAGFTNPPAALLPGDTGVAGNFSFTNGVGLGNFTWDEVGIINLLPSVGDGNYLAAGDVIGRARSGNIGRFVPHHFNMTRVSGCPVGADADLFTYSGQPFPVTATAVAANGSTTRNYHGPFGYAHDGTVNAASAAVNASGSFSGNAFLGANFSQGVRTQNVTYTFNNDFPTPPAKESNPVLLALRLAEDTSVSPTGDGVSSVGGTEQQTQIRSGRVRIFNANGSELFDLNVPMRAEYFNDDWIANAEDSCTAVTLSTLFNFRRELGPGETCVQDTGSGGGISGQGCPAMGPADKQYLSIPSAGSFNLWLKAPGQGNYGSVDLTANLVSNGVPWLRSDWNNDGTDTDDPVGRATFGTYRGNPRHIHLRELY